MKRRIVSIFIALVLLLGLTAIPTFAATEEDILASIELGIPWLVAQQQPNGAWNLGYEPVASTAFAVVKLEDRAYETGYSPFDPMYEYSENVIAGLDFIFSNAYSYGPDKGIVFARGGHETYNTGIAMMAIAASGTPDRVVVSSNVLVNGLTYKQVLDECVEYFVFAQEADGGWRYWINPEGSDNSNTGFAVLGLRYAEDFGCAIPDDLKTRLSAFIDYIQCDINGGSGYVAPCDWLNVMKTGNLLFEMAFVGDASDSVRMQAAIDYIENNWDVKNQDPGWYGWDGGDPSYLAAYCLMKGFESAGIDTITVNRGTPTEVDWFDEMSTRIVDRQRIAGYWAGGNWGNTILDTVWALLTLEKIAPPPPIANVDIDIKPTSCPNPLNVKDKGVLPVAILGTEELDVTTIDPDTIMLQGVSPLRWAVEDVAAPYPGDFSDPLDREDCWTEGPDGYADMTLKFDAQEIVAAIGPVSDGDVLLLNLTGNLYGEGEEPGQAIAGADVVWIKAKGK